MPLDPNETANRLSRLERNKAFKKAQTALLSGKSMTEEQFQTLLDYELHPDWQAAMAVATIDAPFMGPRDSYSCEDAPTDSNSIAYLPIMASGDVYNAKIHVGWVHPSVDIADVRIDADRYNTVAPSSILIGPNCSFTKPDHRYQSLSIDVREDTRVVMIGTTITRRLAISHRAILMWSSLDSLTLERPHNYRRTATTSAWGHYLRSVQGDGQANVYLRNTSFLNSVIVEDNVAFHSRDLCNISRVRIMANTELRAPVFGTAGDEDDFHLTHGRCVRTRTDLNTPRGQLLLGFGIAPDPEGYFTLYKRVDAKTRAGNPRRDKNRFSSTYDPNFLYRIGEEATVPNEAYAREYSGSCGPGLHVSNMNYWAEGDTTLACRIHIDDFIVSLEGKARVTKLTPLWGINGETGEYLTHTIPLAESV